MIKIKSFKETDNEFKELARIDNLVNHDSIADSKEDKNDWNNRDKSLIRDRLLLYKGNQIIGVLYYSQGRDENNRTAFYTLNLDPQYNHNGYRKLLYEKMLDKVKVFNCNQLHTSIYNHPNYAEHKKLIIKNGFELGTVYPLSDETSILKIVPNKLVKSCALLSGSPLEPPSPKLIYR